MNRYTWLAVAGATKYEFWMQVRRPAVWITLAFFGLLLLAGPVYLFTGLPEGTPVSQRVAAWSLTMQYFLPIAFGVVLANRVPRDRRTRAQELLMTLPAPLAARLFGKFAGSTLATLVPLFVLYALGIGYLVVNSGDVGVIPLGIAAFVLINVPGLLFVGAFSVACPAVLWVPLYQVLFVGYWMWGVLLNPEGSIPTISGTWLTPLGVYAIAGFFNTPTPWVRDAAVWEGAASIALLLGLGAVSLICAYLYLRWQYARSS